MRWIKVAAAVLNQTPLAWDANKANILHAIDATRQAGASLLCLPELCISGYGCEDAFHAPGTSAMAWRVLQEILPATGGLIVSIGLPLMFQNSLFNTAAMIVDGAIRGFVAKRFLAGDGIHYEPRWFKPWPRGVVQHVRVGDEDFRLGDIFFNVGGIKIGFEICEDAWVAKRPGAGLALEGVDVILNPSASHFAFGKIEVRKRFVLEGSRAFGVTYVYSNLLGNEAGRAIYDGGAIIASAGALAAIGARFSFAEVGLTVASVDVDATRMMQARTASFSPQIGPDRDDCVFAGFDWPELEPARANISLPAWESGSHVKEEEFARAVALALFDYMRKSHSGGFVVSLSGGADSAAVSALVWLAVHLGVAELGLKQFIAKAGKIPALAQVTHGADAVRALLTCVYQGTRNSSDTTRNAAREVAKAIGAQFLELDVDSIVQQYIQIVSKALGRELSWETNDIALQNIQARARSPGVWMLANVRNALLLSTSNRSEAAVGYATMDGDTSGGLSPVAGIDKAFLRRWLSWLQTSGPDGARPVPELMAVTRQAPTAELRPLEQAQTDEHDLMPYDLLDAIERAAIRDRRAPLEVFRVMREPFAQYSARQLGLWVERFFRLWCRNQWKRERYAPSFHVDDENLDPKTWCRFPILSGSFERELGEMRDYVEKLEANAT